MQMQDKTIILAKLDVDVKDLLKTQANLKTQLDALFTVQGKLTESNKMASREYKENEKALANLYASYNNVSAAISEKMQAGQKQIALQEKLDEELGRSIKTENDYLAANKALIAIKQELSTGNDNYVETINRINSAILENNNWLKENGSELGKLRTNFEDYRQQIADSLDSINIFSTGIGGFIQNAREAGGVGPLLQNAFSGITGGIKGMGAAITANPVGAILQLLLPIIQAIFNAFKSFTPIVEKVEQVMAAVDAVFQSVKNSIIGLLTGATSIGDFFSNFASSAAEAADEAMKLEEAQQKLNKQMQLQEIENERAKNSIDALRAASEDHTKSEEERKKSLQDAIAAEKKNMDERKAIAEETYRIAAEKIASGANLTKEEKAQLKEKGMAYAQELLERKGIAEEEIEALEKAELDRERIYGESAALSRKHITDMAEFQKQSDADKLAAQRETEQKAKQLDDDRKKRQDEALTRQKQQFALWAAEADAHGKSLEARLKFEDDYAKKSLDILRTELRLKKISKAEFDTAEIALEREKGANKLQIAQDYANATLELWQEQHKNQMQSGTKLTDEMVKAENDRLADLYNKNVEMLDMKYENLSRKEIELKQSNNQALTQEETEYLTGILRLNSDFETQKANNSKALEDADKQRKEDARTKEADERALKHEVELAADMTEYDEKKLIENQRYEDEQAELLARQEDYAGNKEQFNILLQNLDKGHQEALDAIDKQMADAKVARQTKLMDDMAGILGRESKAGKAFAIAKATVDTYQGAVAAYESQIVPGDPSSVVRGAIAAAAVVAMGLKNIQKISGVKDPKFEKGGLMSIGGNRHAAGGTKFIGSDGTRFEAEQGELIGVMNRNAASHFMAFNNAFPSGGVSAPNYFAAGGIVSREIAQKGMNMDELAVKIAEANRTLPPPVVAVEDILSHSQSYVRVREGANF